MWYSSGEEDLGDFKETDSELIISLMLSVREPLCFPENANGGKQVLDLLDSSGRKVAPVTFDVEQLFQQQKKGITYTLSLIHISACFRNAPDQGQRAAGRFQGALYTECRDAFLSGGMYCLFYPDAAFPYFPLPQDGGLSLIHI